MLHHAKKSVCMTVDEERQDKLGPELEEMTQLWLIERPQYSMYTCSCMIWRNAHMRTVQECYVVEEEDDHHLTQLQYAQRVGNPDLSDCKLVVHICS